MNILSKFNLKFKYYHVKIQVFQLIVDSVSVFGMLPLGQL